MIPNSSNIITSKLKNGLRVWVYENFGSQTVLINGHVWGGSVNEGPDEQGLASFLAGMLNRGTERRDYDAMNEAIESMGAFLMFNAGRHVLGFNSYSLAEDFHQALDLLAESLMMPAFPESELEKARTRALTHLEERKHSTRSMASVTFNQQIFPPGHPYRIDLDAEMAALHRLQREDLVRFYREKVSPDDGIVVVVGGVPAEQVIGGLERALGEWRHPLARPDKTIPPRPALEERREAHVRVQGKSQSDIVLGWPSFRREDPDYDAAQVTNTILGRFGLGGRLGNRIREELGLAYYAYSMFHADFGPGTWRLAAGVNPANVSLAVDAMLAEVRRLVSEPVQEEELVDVQRFLTGSLPLRLETNGGIAGNLFEMAWYGLGMDYLTEYEARIRSVTREDVLHVAQTYLHPDRYALAVAGPSDEEEA